MNHLDLFSGIGGFAYAAQQVWGKDHNILAFVEKDKYCQKVLNKHWPDVPIIDDIKEYKYGDVANSNTERLQRSGETGNISSKGQDYDKLSARCSENAKMWSVEPNVGRVANGIPNRVHRLKGLGNAIVPQCVMPIMWAIKEIEKL